MECPFVKKGQKSPTCFLRMIACFFVGQMRQIAKWWTSLQNMSKLQAKKKTAKKPNCSSAQTQRAITKIKSRTCWGGSGNSI